MSVSSPSTASVPSAAEQVEGQAEEQVDEPADEPADEPVAEQADEEEQGGEEAASRGDAEDGLQEEDDDAANSTLSAPSVHKEDHVRYIPIITGTGGGKGKKEADFRV